MSEVVFIGGGNIAHALVAGVVNNGTEPGQVLVVDPSAEHRARIETRFRVRVGEVLSRELTPDDVVVWAVKPQVLASVGLSVRKFSAAALQISVAAGVPLAQLRHIFDSSRVIRAMPNTAAAVAASATGLLAAGGVTSTDRELAERLFACVGSTFWVDDDEQMDAVTAVSGSGPAYVFHFMEGFQRAAQEVGFAESEARNLVLQVVTGAAALASRSEQSFAHFREIVTSKQGTTEAALLRLDAQGTQAALQSAIAAATQRAAELSRRIVGN
jgi:pyrroline-5-carboxylate reductase